MKEPHLLLVDAGPERFAALFAAAAAAGLRAGWLELRAPEPAVPSLEAAAALGAMRAVAAGGGRTASWKALRGAPVLRDLLREHFRGCALVLVHAFPEPAPASVPLPPLPTLSPAGDGWQVALPGGGAVLHYDSPGLAAALRRPRPFQ